MKKKLLIAILCCGAMATNAENQEPEKKNTPQEEPRLTLQSENPALKLPQYAGNPNETVGKALKSTGALSMAIGVPCLAAGVACLMYANMKANPTDGYTTSRSKADADGSLEYISVDEWNNKMQKFTRSTHNAEVAGYILTPMGGALTVIGVPLYVKGKKMMQLDVNYTGNGAGISVEF